MAAQRVHQTVGPHFFVEPAAVDGDVALLRGDDANHLLRVLRAQRDDPVSVADGRGRLWQGRLLGGAGGTRGDARVALVAGHTVTPGRPRMTVVHALPKRRKLDEVVQRLTEVGVDRLVPVHSARSEVHLDPARADKALARWRAVALAAAKQSRRPFLLDVAEVAPWQDGFAGARHGVVLWEESTTPLRQVLDGIGDVDEVVLGVGPEGGLTSDEVAATGLPDASLGATVLRTETAALVAAAATRYALRLLG